MSETSASISELLFPAQYRRKALSLLLLNPQRPLHVREIARLTGTSPGTMAKELDRLQRAGLLEKHRVGNQVLFNANETHPVYQELSGLLRKTVGLADVLVNALVLIADRVKVAFVFGSVARASEHATSDVDVMVIGEVELGDVLTALYPAQETLQREINPKVFSAAEWTSKLASGSTFLLEVLAKPKIFLIGAQDDLDALGKPKEDRKT